MVYLLQFFGIQIMIKNIALLGCMAFAISACSSLPSSEPTNSTPSKPTECVAAEAAKLVGQNDLSEAKIKQLTKATIVRKLAPNQPMTMDYRIERVTVTVDPATKKITNASCG
ncbi:hemolysin [Acinetobacter wuhouensis]|uniref:Hemolysin n=1 Tax=Acinetobacter wuhouensis TaxID=1879050 RepID=A0A3G2T2Y3_9GAMM|nr:hemolysin [Acinetobacter wuhouensis]